MSTSCGHFSFAKRFYWLLEIKLLVCQYQQRKNINFSNLTFKTLLLKICQKIILGGFFIFQVWKYAKRNAIPNYFPLFTVKALCYAYDLLSTLIQLYNNLNWYYKGNFDEVCSCNLLKSETRTILIFLLRIQQQ